MSSSVVLVCACCGEKTIHLLFCCTKRLVCRECYQEVCEDCLGSSQTCHKCYIRDRPDAGSVAALKQLDSDELERIVKTLHLDPSKKSDNEWITMIATHCGLPMKPRPPDTNDDHPPAYDKVEPQLPNGSVKQVKKTKSVKTRAISSVAPGKNKSSLHSHIVHELSNRDNEDDRYDDHQTKEPEDDEVDEGIQADDSPKHTLSKDTDSDPDDDSEDDQWPNQEPPAEMSSNRTKSPPRPNTFTSTNSSSLQDKPRQTPSWLSNSPKPPPPPEPEDEEISEVDAKILRNIQLRRQLTVDEQRSLDTFESKLQAWRTKGQQVQSPTSNKTPSWKPENPTSPVVATNIRDIISQMNKGQTKVDVNRHVIEVKNNERPTMVVNPLQSVIKIGKPEAANQQESIVIFDKVEERFNKAKTQQLPEVHRPSEWNKVINLRNTNHPKPWMTDAEFSVQSINRRESNQILNPAKLEMTNVPAIVQLPEMRRDSELSKAPTEKVNFQLSHAKDSNVAKALTNESVANRRDSNLAKLLMTETTSGRRDSELPSKAPTEKVNFQLSHAKDSNSSRPVTIESVANQRDSNLAKLLMAETTSGRRDSNQIPKPSTEKVNFQLSHARDSNSSKPVTIESVANQRDSNQIPKSSTETPIFANVLSSNRRDSNQTTQRTIEAIVHRRDSNQIKTMSTINIVSKPSNDPKPSNQVVSIRNDALNEQSVNTLMSTVANEKAIERMDVLQMRKLLRQLNVKSGAETLFKREELVEEVRRLWRQADEAKNKGSGGGSGKEVVIVVANSHKPNPTPGGAQPVRVTSLRTLSSEEQIRNLNIFQLRSLLMEDGGGSDAKDADGKAQLVDKAIAKWKVVQNK